MLYITQPRIEALCTEQGAHRTMASRYSCRRFCSRSSSSGISLVTHDMETHARICSTKHRSHCVGTGIRCHDPCNGDSKRGRSNNGDSKTNYRQALLVRHWPHEHNSRLFKPCAAPNHICIWTYIWPYIWMCIQMVRQLVGQGDGQ